jgi:hypothetical protein
MDPVKRKALEAAGWRFGDAADFLGLTDEERRPAVIEVPADLLEAVANLRFPPKTAQLVQSPRDRNNEGTLPPTERADLEALVELRKTMGLVRARALNLLGRNPA